MIIKFLEKLFLSKIFSIFLFTALPTSFVYAIVTMPNSNLTEEVKLEKCKRILSEHDGPLSPDLNTDACNFAYESGRMKEMETGVLTGYELSKFANEDSEFGSKIRNIILECSLKKITSCEKFQEHLEKNVYGKDLLASRRSS